MSNDRNHDEQVSATYRDLAKERTPSHLDENVMRMAQANAQRPRYSRWVSWSRPLAWAATVALCLAITLEVTQVTTTDDAVLGTLPAEPTAPSAAYVPEQQKDEREQELERDMDQQAVANESMADSIAESVSPEKLTVARSAAKQTANEPAPAARMRQSSSLAEEEMVAESVAVQSMELEMKALAESRRENDNVLGYAQLGDFAADMPENECSEDARSEPESWFECIEELEAGGNVDAAARQRENLEETFPDFKIP